MTGEILIENALEIDRRLPRPGNNQQEELTTGEINYG